MFSLRSRSSGVWITLISCTYGITLNRGTNIISRLSLQREESCSNGFAERESLPRRTRVKLSGQSQVDSLTGRVEINRADKSSALRHIYTLITSFIEISSRRISSISTRSPTLLSSLQTLGSLKHWSTRLMRWKKPQAVLIMLPQRSS